jgi:hypothetical protein
MNTSFDADAKARLQGKRAALGAIIGIAVLFIGASAAQIIPAVFGLDHPRNSPLSEGSSARDCAQRIRSLALAVDRASANAWSTHTISDGEAADDSPPLRAFRHALIPEWTEAASVRQTCFKTPEGTEAWASLVRLRSTQEQLMIRDFSELLPLRRDFAAHLPTDLR